MRSGRGKFAIVAVAIALTTGAAVAATGSSDEQALQPAGPAANKKIEQKVNALLGKMTTKEKLQQVQLLSDGQISDDAAEAGVGAVFSLTDPAKIEHFQRIAVEQSRLHIPILFAYDTIHGYRTIFPVPLGAATTRPAATTRRDESLLMTLPTPPNGRSFP